MAWSLATWSPSFTKTLTTTPESAPSPSLGSLTSIINREADWREIPHFSSNNFVCSTTRGATGQLQSFFSPWERRRPAGLLHDGGCSTRRRDASAPRACHVAGDVDCGDMSAHSKIAGDDACRVVAPGAK